VVCLSKLICQFLLICFKVHISKISDKTDEFLLNYSSLFLSLLSIWTQCITVLKWHVYVYWLCVDKLLLSVFVMQSLSDGVVLLNGKAGKRSVEFSITVDSSQNVSPVDAAQPIHRLAAKAQIKQLEDGENGTLLLLHIGVHRRSHGVHWMHVGGR